MNLDDLKDKGYKIVTNWQECSKKSIFLFNSNNNQYRPLNDYNPDDSS